MYNVIKNKMIHFFISRVHQLIHGFAITNNLFPIPFAIRKNSQCSTSMNFDYNNMFLHEINYSEVSLYCVYPVYTDSLPLLCVC